MTGHSNNNLAANHSKLYSTGLNYLSLVEPKNDPLALQRDKEALLLWQKLNENIVYPLKKISPARGAHPTKGVESNMIKIASQPSFVGPYFVSEF